MAKLLPPRIPTYTPRSEHSLKERQELLGLVPSIGEPAPPLTRIHILNVRNAGFYEEGCSFFDFEEDLTDAKESE